LPSRTSFRHRTTHAAAAERRNHEIRTIIRHSAKQRSWL